ncbi:universal stress protein [Jannaschia rubra]|uniref:UspA domain-containing protein n=1 Tax=Jannaschia rubra TaxID=282197 RepID=A0A0M6XRY6_9RHOB|nr:universal stress protein [Jannaschia rubra]CTQ32941.1 hypothetical protein JAN5088_01715 [Jannaschia rubra]SFG26946.1 Nucleotide-binding universal stress protein, UspA family [Jannaschia rubra]
MGPIIVATDLSPRSDRAMLRAARIAKEQDAPLHILHILDEELPAAILHGHAEDAKKTLQSRVDQTPEIADRSPRVDIEVGHLSRLLPGILSDRKPGLLVLGSHRDRGLAELIGQPSLSRIMAVSDVPILLAVGEPDRDYAKALAGWDFSAAGNAAVDLSRRIAPDASLTLVHAWDDFAAVAPYGGSMGVGASPATVARLEESMESAVADLHKTYPDATIDQHTQMGGAAHVILRLAADRSADLIVMGRHARSGIARFFLGHTATAVALRSPCDVLIAPSS